MILEPEPHCKGHGDESHSDSDHSVKHSQCDDTLILQHIKTLILYDYDLRTLLQQFGLRYLIYSTSVWLTRPVFGMKDEHDLMPCDILSCFFFFIFS